MAKTTSEQSMDVAEDARETDWKSISFAAELFMGNYRPELIYPYPMQDKADKEIGDKYIEEVESFLKKNLDPDQVDLDHQIPDTVVKGLADLGAFGIKTPTEYGGLGMSQINYCRVMSMVSSYCASTAVLLSAHQSIGVPVPLKDFGTDEQKKKYLPLLAAGAISAFALTEPNVGSDPAQMTTFAELSEDGSHYILNGTKLWCTNGAIADILIVIACTKPIMIKGRERKQISAFIVEREWEGFNVKHRCSFMGLNGIQNALLEFKDVKVPVENIVVGEGRGLKIALSTLNTGRLTLPAAGNGISKKAFQYARKWSREREQWGRPIGKHESIEDKMAKMATDIFAVDALSDLCCALVDKGGRDIRVEAAFDKLVGSELSWDVLDTALQVCGGRGYETALSKEARGEHKWPIERMFRDSRINTIIEGTSDIMHLFLAREVLDPHMKAAGALTKPRSPNSEKIKSLFKAGWFYLKWFPRQLPLLSLFSSHSLVNPELRKHSRFVARYSKVLARNVFYAMMRYQAGLEHKQILMSRLVDIGKELFVMSACCAKATAMKRINPIDSSPIELADLYCRGARSRVKSIESKLFSNDTKQIKKVNQRLRDDKLNWVESNIFSEEEKE